MKSNELCKRKNCKSKIKEQEEASSTFVKHDIHLCNERNSALLEVGKLKLVIANASL